MPPKLESPIFWVSLPRLSRRLFLLPQLPDVFHSSCANAASLEEEVFGKQQPSIVSDADFIADDLPRNADYLESYRSTQPEPLNSFENVDLEGKARPGVVLDVNGETITLLDPQGTQIVEDYWLTMLGKGGAKKKP
jgi:hypothetical protein